MSLCVHFAHISVDFTPKPSKFAALQLGSQSRKRLIHWHYLTIGLLSDWLKKFYQLIGIAIHWKVCKIFPLTHCRCKKDIQILCKSTAYLDFEPTQDVPISWITRHVTRILRFASKKSISGPKDTQTRLNVFPMNWLCGWLNERIK